MNFQLDKRMKIYIGAGVAGIAVIVFFSVLLFSDNGSREALPVNIPQQTETVHEQPQQKEQQQPEQQNTEKESNENKSNPGSVLQNAPYSRVYFDGKTHVVNPGDLVVDSQGNLLIKARYLGEGLGIPVSWEKDTVWIGLQPVKDGAPDEVAQFLSDMDYLRFYTPEGKQMSEMTLNKDRWSKESYFKVAGKEYQKGIGLNLKYGWDSNEIPISVDYNTAGNYKAFKALVGVDDEFKNADSKFVVRVYGDNQKKFESKEFRGGDFPIPVEVDVTGVIRLTIEVERVSKNNSSSDTKIVIANARLTK